MGQPAPGETDEWRPIDTAPQDGTVILAFTAEAQWPGVKITWWHDGVWLTTGKPEKFVDPRPHRWWPTHWQAMPSVPLAAKASRPSGGALS